MGLDMYLDKVKILTKDIPANNLLKKLGDVNNYYSWLHRPKEYQSSSLEEWSRTSIDDVDMELVDKYQHEYKKRYSVWDKDCQYGFETIFQPIGYWRKANQIHGWFVKHVQNDVDDCGSYLVTKEQLEKLLDACEKVNACSVLVNEKVQNGYSHDDKGNKVPVYAEMKIIANPTVAKELLPCESGFFFGNIEYDEWYYEDIKSTIHILKKVLEETDFTTEMVLYSSSW